jgi:hypothetical protein
MILLKSFLPQEDDDEISPASLADMIPKSLKNLGVSWMNLSKDPIGPLVNLILSALECETEK